MTLFAVHLWYSQYSNPNPTSDLTYYYNTHPEHTPTPNTQLSPWQKAYCIKSLLLRFAFFLFHSWSHLEKRKIKPGLKWLGITQHALRHELTLVKVLHFRHYGFSVQKLLKIIVFGCGT